MHLDVCVDTQVISFHSLQYKHTLEQFHSKPPVVNQGAFLHSPTILSSLLLCPYVPSFCLPFTLTLMKTFFEMFTKATIRPCFFPSVKSTLPTTSPFLTAEFNTGRRWGFLCLPIGTASKEIWHEDNCTFKGNATRPLFTRHFPGSLQWPLFFENLICLS